MTRHKMNVSVSRSVSRRKGVKSISDSRSLNREMVSTKKEVEPAVRQYVGTDIGWGKTDIQEHAQEWYGKMNGR